MIEKPPFDAITGPSKRESRTPNKVGAGTEQTTAITHVILSPPLGVSPGVEFGPKAPSFFQEAGV